MTTSGRLLVRILGLVCLTFGAVWLVVVGTLWWQTAGPAPTFHVRWAPKTTAATRAKAERTLRLVRPEDLGQRTWAYDMLDSTPENIERIVKHPLVEDTQDIDRKTFVLTEHAQPGKTQRWVGDRLPVLDSRERVFTLSWVAGGLVLVGLLGLWLIPRAPKTHNV